ncbi:hypothetical protein FQA39_LY13818 [Lamprigera yunnana]|nr:hypothetical protein FQA39_LY13818 [Lamprigera yunnana]
MKREKESKGFIIPVDRVYERLAEATGISSRTIKRITQEGRSKPEGNIPVGLPLRTVEDVLSLEKYLSNGDNLSALVSYLSTLGGRDLTNKTNIIFRSLLTNEVAQLYSYRGTGLAKRALSTLNLKTVVVRAVQTGCSATENDVCSNIKVWLKHTRQRPELENKRKSDTIDRRH